LALVWLVFLAVLGVVVLGAAEGGLRVRREWIAAHVNAPPNEDDRFIADRLLRFKNRPSYRYGDERVHYTNNTLGLRGPEILTSKPNGWRRVVLLGGSTVYGAMVDDADTISVQLEVLLRQDLGPDIEVINAGVPGYESLREVVFARAELFALEPDVVIDLDGLNDVFYGSLEEWPSQIAADELGIIADRRFADIVSIVDSTLFPHGLIEHQLTMLGRDLRPRAYAAVRRRQPAPPRILNHRLVTLHAELLGSLASYAVQHRVSVIAGLQPLVATGHKPLAAQEREAVDRNGYWDAGGWAEMALEWYPRLAATTRAAVVQHGGVFVDMTGVFDQELEPTYADDAVHYTALADRRLAQSLAPVVKDLLVHRPADGSEPASIR
jgi:hypothetical protein